MSSDLRVATITPHRSALNPWIKPILVIKSKLKYKIALSILLNSQLITLNLDFDEEVNTYKNVIAYKIEKSIKWTNSWCSKTKIKYQNYCGSIKLIIIFFFTISFGFRKYILIC